jgi:hypothetical protein
MQNVQEVVATTLTSHSASLSSLSSQVGLHAKSLSDLSRSSGSADATIKQLKEENAKLAARLGESAGLEARVRSLEASLSAPPPPAARGPSLDSIVRRLEALETNRQVEDNNKRVVALVAERMGSPPRSPARGDGGVGGVVEARADAAAAVVAAEDAASSVSQLRAELGEVRGLLASLSRDPASPASSRGAPIGQAELEEVREELWDALEGLKRLHLSQVGGGSNNPPSPPDKENVLRAAKNAILDEVAISRPDRVEIERLVMTRLEPVAGSLNSLHAEVGEMRRCGAGAAGATLPERRCRRHLPFFSLAGTCRPCRPCRPGWWTRSSWGTR